ncbi:MAG: LSU ribosomal protein L3p (L3e) [Ktedonobacterales bacterium]|jgi:large subunit ribosomal protein L3|nr:MAG: LSU ribosomal protein L3p (L3e) [Ktedonobacterales bacterium]
MLSALLGRKVGMTQIFGPNGVAIPVTVIEAGPCTITQVKTAATDGYEAVQLGFGEVKLKHVTRPMLGHLGHALPQTPRQRRKQQLQQAKSRQEARKKTASAASETEADVAEATATKGSAKQQPSAKRRRGSAMELGPFKILREVELISGDQPAVGDTVDAAMFATGERVDIIGTSKGKGFAGVMKRHGFGGGQRTHGQSDRARAPGSIGPGTTPGRVFKGTRMAGRMGNDRITIKSLEVVQTDATRNLLVIKGSIPGPNGSVVMIRKGAEQMALAARSGASARRS